MRTSPILLAFALVSAGCAPAVLPPPPRPGQWLPRIADPGPPAPGTNRVVIDTVGEEALVSERGGGPLGLDLEHPVCTTPCAVDLPLGAHELQFVSRDHLRRGSTIINVGARPVAVREALDQHTDHPGLTAGGLVLAGIGTAAATVGGVLAGIAGGINGPVGGVLVSGVVAAIAGTIMAVLGRGTVRPARDAQWTFARPAAWSADED